MVDDESSAGKACAGCSWRSTMMFFKINRKFILLFLTCLAVLVFAPTVYAATITADGVTCTLENAIISANTDTNTGGCVGVGGYGADIIILDADVNLTTAYAGSTNIGGGQSGLPDITSDITIQAGVGNTISGNSTNFRIFYIDTGGSLTLDGLTVTGGSIAPASGVAQGGGIYVDGGATLTLFNTTVTNNWAVAGE